MRSRIFSHLLTSFRHQSGLLFVTVLVLTGSFFVTGGLLLAGQNLNRVLTLWGESLHMSIYLKENVTPEQTESLRRRMDNDKRIGRVEWIGREQALASFQEQLASYAPDLLKDADLMRFIPQSFQVRVSDLISATTQLETLRVLSDELKSFAGVEEVSFGQEWVKTYASIVKAFTQIGGWIMIILIAASLFMISNAVSSSILQRKSEIEVLELVGASKWFIRGPFLAEGLLAGAFSGALALILLSVGFAALRNQFSLQIAFLQLSQSLQFFSATAMFGFLMTAAAAGLVSAALSLRKLNDGWAASRSSREH